MPCSGGMGSGEARLEILQDPPVGGWERGFCRSGRSYILQDPPLGKVSRCRGVEVSRCEVLRCRGPGGEASGWF